MGIDWPFWMDEEPVRLMLWSTPTPLYFWLPRICILLAGAAMFTLSLAFVAWIWQRHRGPITFE